MAQSTAFAHHVVVFQADDMLHIVWRPRVEEPSVKATPHFGRSHGAHPQLDDTHPLSSVPFKYLSIMRSVVAFEMKQPTHAEQVGESCNTATPITTHRPQTAVAIVVVHLKIKTR